MEEPGETLVTPGSSIRSGLHYHSYGKPLEEFQISNTQPGTSTQSGVDVARAEKDLTDREILKNISGLFFFSFFRQS